MYKNLKYLALIVLPAFGTLYFALSQIWGFPSGIQVVGSITAFDTFLGVCLHIRTIQYNKSEAKYDGTIDVIDTPEKKSFHLNLNGDPNDIDTKKEVLFKINSSS